MTSLKKRNIFVMFLLSFLTCGIYAIYWFFTAISEMNSDLSRNCPDEKTINPIIVFFLSPLTCGIYGLYAMYVWANNIKRLGEYYNVQTTDPIVTFLLSLFGVGWYLMQNDYNKVVDVVEAYNHQQAYAQTQAYAQSYQEQAYTEAQNQVVENVQPESENQSTEQ